MQLQIRWLMVIVAVLAIFLSLPWPVPLLCLMVGLIAGIFVLLPAALAPRGHRVEVAYWAMALHPLIFLAWLSIWRFLFDPRPLRPTDGGWYLTLTLEIPYLLAWLSYYYLWVFFAAGAIVGFVRFSERIVLRPLLILLAVWLMTLVVLGCDPWGMRYWFWD
jgi:hypothetical protein